MYNGFINLNKPSGDSSNKALFSIKRILRNLDKDTKVGHLGTLDPLACGVLPVSLGRATRLFEYCLKKSKRYRAEFTFGVTSDSLDLGTELIPVSGENVTLDTINSVLPDFIGSFAQVPPMYSAKSIGGVRAYKMARKGQSIDLPAKRIEVFDIQCVAQTGENSYQFVIECGSGTYIRSLARDIGSAVGSSAVMSYLCRERSGIFELNKAISPDTLTDQTLISSLIPMECVLSDLPKYYLKDKEMVILNGIHICIDNPQTTAIYLDDGTLVGIGEQDENGMTYIKTRLL